MYRKDSEGWLKHADFIVLDLLCLQISFILAYVLSGYGWNPYHIMLYRNMSIFLELADLLVIFCYDTMKGVLKKGYYRDFVVTLKHSIMVEDWQFYICFCFSRVEIIRDWHYSLLFYCIQGSLILCENSGRNL